MEVQCVFLQVESEFYLFSYLFIYFNRLEAVSHAAGGHLAE
jgi:hypothetical protein